MYKGKQDYKLGVLLRLKKIDSKWWLLTDGDEVEINGLYS